MKFIDLNKRKDQMNNKLVQEISLFQRIKLNRLITFNNTCKQKAIFIPHLFIPAKYVSNKVTIHPTIQSTTQSVRYVIARIMFI